MGEFSHQGQFELLKELYHSGCGSVHLARVKDQRSRAPQHVVLKRRKVPELGRAKDMLNEYEVLKQLKHPNIIQCFGYFWEFHSHSLFIVLEYASRGDLHAELQVRRRLKQPFTDPEVWDIFSQVLSGLAHIHAKGIVHRDIKSLNLFLTSAGVVKLGDFGVSRQMSEQTLVLNSFYGTPLYLSPELIEGRPYTQTTDVWSMGVVLYELLAMRSPFNGPCLQDVISAIVNGSYLAIPRTRSADLGRLVGAMLTKEPKKRPTAAQLLQYLERLGHGEKRNQGQVPGAPEVAVADQPRRVRAASSTPGCDEGAPPAGPVAAESAAATEEGPVKVVRVRKRRPASACPTKTLPPKDQLLEALDGASDQPSSQPRGLSSADGEQGWASQEIAPRAAPVRKPSVEESSSQRDTPKSLRELRWEERRKEHVMHIPIRGSKDATPFSAGKDQNGCPAMAWQEGELAKGSQLWRPFSPPQALVQLPPRPRPVLAAEGQGRQSTPQRSPGSLEQASAPSGRAASEGPSCRPFRSSPEPPAPRGSAYDVEGQVPRPGRYDIIGNRWIS